MIKTGILIVNEFLNSPKFDELYVWFIKSAERFNINLSILTNREIMIGINDKKIDKNIIDTNKIDFILFWDKDILLARYLENLGFRVYNSSNSIEICDDKALTYVMLANSGIKIPKTIIPPFTYNEKYNSNQPKVKSFINDIEKELGYPMVVKARRGSFGAQVHLINNPVELVEMINRYDSNNIIFQEYISSSKGRDIRLQVVGDKVVASMYRYSENDFRANITNGGKMKLYEPSQKEVDMAIKVCRQLGLDFAGVDILFGEDNEPILCEVNSNAHFVNIYKCTGVNVADEIVKYIREERN